MIAAMEADPEKVWDGFETTEQTLARFLAESWEDLDESPEYSPEVLLEVADDLVEAPA
jgi:hypothetical protein